VPHNEAVLVCPNCGCPPNAREYTVLANGANFAEHKLKDNTVSERKVGN